MDYWPLVLVGVMFSAKAFDHNLKNLSHEHWTRRLWIKDLAVANWYHVASFAVTWPVMAYLLWPELSHHVSHLSDSRSALGCLLAHLWPWYTLAVVLQGVWWGAKVMSGRVDARPWYVQVAMRSFGR